MYAKAAQYSKTSPCTNKLPQKDFQDNLEQFGKKYNAAHLAEHVLGNGR